MSDRSMLDICLRCGKFNMGIHTCRKLTRHDVFDKIKQYHEEKILEERYKYCNKIKEKIDNIIMSGHLYAKICSILISVCEQVKNNKQRR